MPPESRGISVVWLKRDLRLQDHEPLAKACDSGRPLLILYVLEPSLRKDPHYAPRHWRFVQQSLDDMAKSLAGVGGHLTLFEQEVIPLFDQLHRRYPIHTLYSHQEVGIETTWQRDRDVSHWCLANGVDWHESDYGVVRRPCHHRQDWDAHWKTVIHSSPTHPDFSTLEWVPPLADRLPDLGKAPDWPAPDSGFQEGGFQAGGRQQALRTLGSFCEGRGLAYARHISSPSMSRDSCSRLSPYLAWGNLSLRKTGYPQFQMQAGMTGTNLLRVYNPFKQAAEQDPQGTFIREWVPEIAHWPNELLWDPLAMTPLEAQMLADPAVKAYPQAPADLLQRAQRFRDLWWQKGEEPAVLNENLRILRRHVRPERQGGWA